MNPHKYLFDTSGFIYKEIIKQKHMKCAILECDKQAYGNFKCCSTIHGSTLNTMVSGLDDLFSADLDNKELREAWTIEEVTYYQQYA